MMDLTVAVHVPNNFSRYYW